VKRGALHGVKAASWRRAHALLAAAAASGGNEAVRELLCAPCAAEDRDACAVRVLSCSRPAANERFNVQGDEAVERAA
jgi:hypothetical protein